MIHIVIQGDSFFFIFLYRIINIMQPLNLPTYSFNIKSDGKRTLIFDEIRKKYVQLTPEEWVRQNFIEYLASEKRFPKALIGVEVHFKVNRLSKRGDILLFDRKGTPRMIVECKAPSVNINQKAFDQIARYNMKFRVEYLIVTNGMKHFCCRMEYEKGSYTFLNEIPSFEELDK